MADKERIDPVYSHLAVHKTRQTSFYIIMIAVFLIISFYMFFRMMAGSHWIELVVPILLVNSILIIFPETEKWIYHPWQKTTRKIEHHYLK